MIEPLHGPCLPIQQGPQLQKGTSAGKASARVFCADTVVKLNKSGAKYQRVLLCMPSFALVAKVMKSGEFEVKRILQYQHMDRMHYASHPEAPYHEFVISFSNGEGCFHYRPQDYFGCTPTPQFDPWHHVAVMATLRCRFFGGAGLPLTAHSSKQSLHKARYFATSKRSVDEQRRDAAAAKGPTPGPLELLVQRGPKGLGAQLDPATLVYLRADEGSPLHNHPGAKSFEGHKVTHINGLFVDDVQSARRLLRATPSNDVLLRFSQDKRAVQTELPQGHSQLPLPPPPPLHPPEEEGAGYGGSMASMPAHKSVVEEVESLVRPEVRDEVSAEEVKAVSPLHLPQGGGERAEGGERSEGGGGVPPPPSIPPSDVLRVQPDPVHVQAPVQQYANGVPSFAHQHHHQQQQQHHHSHHNHHQHNQHHGHHQHHHHHHHDHDHHHHHHDHQHHHHHHHDHHQQQHGHHHPDQFIPLQNVQEQPQHSQPAPQDLPDYLQTVTEAPPQSAQHSRRSVSPRAREFAALPVPTTQAREVAELLKGIGEETCGGEEDPAFELVVDAVNKLVDRQGKTEGMLMSLLTSMEGAMEETPSADESDFSYDSSAASLELGVFAQNPQAQPRQKRPSFRTHTPLQAGSQPGSPVVIHFPPARLHTPSPLRPRGMAARMPRSPVPSSHQHLADEAPVWDLQPTFATTYDTSPRNVSPQGRFACVNCGALMVGAFCHECGTHIGLSV